MTAFVALLFITIVSAVVVVTTRHIVHAAIFLAFSFVGVGGIYLMLEAPFIAASQVLIYAGAITVLILFALMLTAQTVMREPRHARETKLLAAVVSLVFFFAVLLPTLTRAGCPIRCARWRRGCSALISLPSRSPQCCFWWRWWAPLSWRRRSGERVGKSHLALPPTAPQWG